MSFETTKQAILDKAKTKNCTELYSIIESNSYDQLFSVLIEFFETFQCDVTYLKDILLLVPDSELTTRGVYYNKTGNLTNPVVVVASVIDTINITTFIPRLLVVETDIANINVNSPVGYVSISGGSSVAELSVSASIKLVAIKSCYGLIPNSVISLLSGKENISEITIDKNTEITSYTCPTSE